MSSVQTVAVTGAKGFLGRQLCRSLADSGYAVRRVVRHAEAPSDVALGDIGSVTDWAEALRGVDAVLHLAAIAHRNIKFQAGHLEEVHRINVVATESLAIACRSCGVKRLVFASTVGVHGLTTQPGQTIGEDSTLKPSTPYAQSKAEAEARLRLLADDNFAVAALRFPLVCGADAPGNFGQLVSAIRHGIPLPFANIHNQRSFASARLIASFLSHCLSRPASGFEPYILAHAELISTRELAEMIGESCKRPARLLPVPPALLAYGFAMLDRSESADGLLQSLCLDISKALSTGWAPPSTLSDAIREDLAR